MLLSSCTQALLLDFYWYVNFLFRLYLSWQDYATKIITKKVPEEVIAHKGAASVSALRWYSFKYVVCQLWVFLGLGVSPYLSTEFFRPAALYTLSKRFSVLNQESNHPG